MFLLNGGLLWLIRDLNHLIAPLGIWLWVPALTLIVPVFLLPLGFSLTLTAVLGAMTEAWAPVAPGRVLFLWLLIWLSLALLRTQTRREQVWHLTIIAILCNSCAFLVWHTLSLWLELTTVRFWAHAFGFGLLNAITIAICLPLWIQLQTWVLVQFGWREEDESQ
ncbi:MAG: hypothetical protein LR015_03510 [Verrucomicrobia bacterium]|nr:hypothetical protein [Verrucomicrobiota bacterium]